MNKEEYEIIFVPNEGRAVKNNITGKIYYSEFQIIEEKNKEIERLNNIINELEKYCWELKEMGCREGALDMLDKIKELKEGK